MSGFGAEWLALREPADRAARDAGLVARLADALRGRTPLTVVDLGCGTGSNLRALAPRLSDPQSWRLVDNDADLLAIASTTRIAEQGGHAVTLETHRADLASAGWSEELRGADLIAMSALLDLVSEAFLSDLASAARAESAAIYAALTVDGRMACAPSDPLDEAVFAAFRVHMAGDKGFGPALGPSAATTAGHMLAVRGFAVETAPSDWIIGPDQRELASALLEGWIAAAGETGRIGPAALAGWATRRRGEIAVGSLELRVGHVDLLALPR